ncbi:MAG: S-methyl-5-thioribose-1-phosphate isomerase [Candidatus Woesearchaeota archaeon]
MDLNTTIKKIKSLEIQGATNITKAALAALNSHSQKIKVSNSEQFFRELSRAKTELSTSRPTEPEMRNMLSQVYSQLKSSNTREVNQLRRETKKLCEDALRVRSEAMKKITEYGSNLVKNNLVVYTHCHSSSVTSILIEAHKKKKFIVHNTETRPRYQGRLTAAELAKANIPVIHFVDSAMRLALKKADMVMIGADSVTTTKVINKIGSELVAEVAKRYDIPVYVCASSWKFSPETALGYDEVIEERQSKEVWDKAPKGVKIMNYAFEKIDFNNITAIISDLGVLEPEVFVQEVRKKYSWAKT